MPLPFDDPYNAFCTDTDAFLEGAAGGPLSGLTFAAKGPVRRQRSRHWWRQSGLETHPWTCHGAFLAGGSACKSGGHHGGQNPHTDELSRGIFGENAHYGTPINPAAPGHVPGGSSSGSVAAVAGGLVDFALGTDTGGSVRVPASFCGVVGMRTSHGRIPFTHAIDQAPSFDTVGWFARDAITFAGAGEVLLEKHHRRPCSAPSDCGRRPFPHMPTRPSGTLWPNP